MYKTIRHGENSLQYTILPQNDDFRIEGKLTSAESSCSSTGRKLKTKRPKRRSFFAYLGLIFVCTVIVGAVLIPFLVSAECLPNPTDWFLGKNLEKHDKPNSGLKGHGSASLNSVHSNFISSGINIGKTVKIINQAGVEKVILRFNKTSTNATENFKPNSNSQIQNHSKDTNEPSKADLEKIASVSTTPTIVVQSPVHNEVQKFKSNNDNDNMKEGKQNIQNRNQVQVENLQFHVDFESKQTKAVVKDNDPSNDNRADNSQNEQFVTEVRFEPVESVSSKPIGIMPTIVVTTLRNHFSNNEAVNEKQQQAQQEQLIAQSQTAPNVRPTTTFSSLISAIHNGSNSTTPPTASLMTRIIQVPLLKAAAKKPVIPPVLVKTKSQLSSGNGYGSIGNADLDLITSPPLTQQHVVKSDLINTNSPDTIVEPARANDWIHAHWPFIDPSTYFQWTGYKAEDSVLLPALLGFALIGMILIITVCLVARNKRTIVSSVRKRNRNDVEENGTEDNTTLLTTTNLSDED